MGAALAPEPSNRTCLAEARRRKSITRPVILTVFLLTVVPVGPAVRVGSGAAGAPAWRSAPEYVALFAPANRRDRYRADVTSESLDAVLLALRNDPTLAGVPGAWEVHNESAQDAFGTAGLYNKWMLTQAYGSGSARVARGGRMERGQVVEAWALISPYPSPDLRTLHPGTMRLILTVDP